MPNFVSFATYIAELAHGENMAYSLTHSASLFDAPGTEACASEQRLVIIVHMTSLFEVLQLTHQTLSALLIAIDGKAPSWSCMMYK